MKRRSFLGLFALPLVALVPKAKAELVPPPGALYKGELGRYEGVVFHEGPYIVEEVTMTIDSRHQCAMSWQMSDGRRNAFRMTRLDPARKIAGRVYPQHLEEVTEEEKLMLREQLRAWAWPR